MWRAQGNRVEGEDRMIAKLYLPIEPVAWQRVKRGRFGQAYVPSKTRKYKESLALLIKKEFKKSPASGPLILYLYFGIRKPKTVKRRIPDVRPDLDNYIKAFKDAANGVLWHDDSQVVTLIAEKAYVFKPAVEAMLKEWGT